MTTATRSRDQRESLVPRHPSNRAFCNQMIEWGWEPKKQNSSHVTMVAPMGDETVKVAAPHQHDANPVQTFLDVYRLTTQGDADLFWRGPSELWKQMLDQHRLKRDAPKPTVDLDSLQVPQPQPKEPPMPTPRKQHSYQPGRTGKRSDLVLALAKFPDGGSPGEIAEAMGFDPTDRMVTRGLANRLSYNAKLPDSPIESVRRGLYRLKQGRRQEPTVLTVTTSASPAVFVPVEAQPVETIWTAPAPTQSMDDVLEAVLDLLLPNGFKARHMRFIQPWMTATQRMIEEVTSE